MIPITNFDEAKAQLSVQQIDKVVKKMHAHLQLMMFYYASIGENAPDFSTNDFKYYIKFTVYPAPSKPTGFALHDTVSYDFDNDTTDASIFRFKTKEDAKAFGREHNDLFEEYIL